MNSTVYGNCCNQLEKQLCERNYKQKIVRGKNFFSGTLLNNESKPLVRNPTSHLLLKNFQRVLNEAQNMLNEGHKLVLFGENPLIGSHKDHPLKGYLVRAKISNKDIQKSKSA